MKKLINTRLVTLTFCGLGFFAILSLSSCDEAGDAANQQEKDKTEKAAPSEKAKEAEHPNRLEADTTDHAKDEHPSGGSEHPTGGDEHPK